MPLWIVFHPPTTFQDDDTKRAFAQDVTKIYTTIGLPKFYVTIEFIQQSVNNVWVGGEKREGTPFIRIMIDHIAAKMPDSEAAGNDATVRFVDAIKPHIVDKGYDYEFHIDETSRRLWRINGFVPPVHPSDGEALWARENRPVAYN